MENKVTITELVKSKLRKELTSKNSLTNVIADLVLEYLDTKFPDAGAGEGGDSGDGPEL